MAITNNWGYVKRTIAGSFVLLTLPSAASAKSKFLSLSNGADTHSFYPEVTQGEELMKYSINLAILTAALMIVPITALAQDRCLRNGDDAASLSLDGDFSGCDYSGEDFSGMDIMANLRNANLSGVNFDDASFIGADLTGSTGPGNNSAATATFMATTCADSTTVDENGGTCVGHGTGW